MSSRPHRHASFHPLTLLLAWTIRQASRLRYRIHLEGLTEITSELGARPRGVLILASHASLADPILLNAFLFPVFRARPLALRDDIDLPGIRLLARLVGTESIPEMGKVPLRQGAKAIDLALRSLAAQLRAGENLLVYPSGQLQRSREQNLGNKSSVQRLLRLAPETQIVLLRTTGLWGSSFSYADGHKPKLSRVFARVFRGLLLSGIFFMPRRKVNLQFSLPKDFPNQGTRREMNRFIEDYLNEGASPKLYVPYHPWDRIVPGNPDQES